MPRLESFLAHYASKYYDPEKAREYYLRTRELKGRKLSRKQQEAFDYASGNIATARKGELDAAAEASKAEIEQIRAQATDTRDAIVAKIQAWAAQLAEESSGQRDQLTAESRKQRMDISEKLKADIANLPPIPKGITGARREQLMEARRAQSASLREAAGTELDKLSNEGAQARKQLSDKSRGERQAVSAQGSAEREQVANDLKATIAAARERYEQTKLAVRDKFEKETQTERDNIRQQVR